MLCKVVSQADKVIVIDQTSYDTLVGMGYENVVYLPNPLSREVVDIVQNLTAIAEENAASTEETSASVTEVTAIVNNISEKAAELKAIADDLDQNMQQFKI